MLTEKELNQMFILKAKVEERARKVAYFLCDGKGYPATGYNLTDVVVFINKVCATYNKRHYNSPLEITFPTKYLIMSDEDIAEAERLKNE